MTQPETPDKSHLEALLAEVLKDLPALLRRFDDGAIRLLGTFDDFVQEVRLAASTGLPTFSPTGDLKEGLRKYISGIARNMHTDLLRRMNRLVSSVEDEVLADAARDNLTPSRIMAKDQALASLRDCLLKLGDSDRQLVMLKYDRGQLLREIAGTTKLTEDQVDHRLQRVRKTLRECLESSGTFRFIANGG